MDPNTLKMVTEILTLFNGLAPSAIVLIKTLAQDMQGKTDAEILAESDALYQGVIDKAKKELGIA